MKTPEGHKCGQYWNAYSGCVWTIIKPDSFGDFKLEMIRSKFEVKVNRKINGPILLFEIVGVN